MAFEDHETLRYELSTIQDGISPSDGANIGIKGDRKTWGSYGHSIGTAMYYLSVYKRRNDVESYEKLATLCRKCMYKCNFRELDDWCKRGRR
jgi:hypothetical protein